MIAQHSIKLVLVYLQMTQSCNIRGQHLLCQQCHFATSVPEDCNTIFRNQKYLHPGSMSGNGDCLHLNAAQLQNGVGF